MFEREAQEAERARSRLPARAVLVAAGTTPNIIYEKEEPGTFELDAKKKFFQPHTRGASGDGVLHAGAGCRRASSPRTTRDGRFVSYYGDNHPRYAGNVVKAMASAKHGYRRSWRCSPTSSRRSIRRQQAAARRGVARARRAQLDDDLLAHGRATSIGSRRPSSRSSSRRRPRRGTSSPASSTGCRTSKPWRRGQRDGRQRRC